MWNGKNKALTFSFDDAVRQDKRLIEIFNKYGLKCTFNIYPERWERFEEFCKMISGKEDIFYGTNKEVLL